MLLTSMFFLPKIGQVSAHPIQLAFLRYAGGVVFLIALMAVSAIRDPISPRLLDYRAMKWHVARALVGLVTLTLTLYAATAVPIANVQAILSAHSIFIILLILVIDQHRIRFFVVVCVFVCIAGAVVAAEPEATGFLNSSLLGYLAAALAAFCWGLEVYLFRNASRYVTTLTTMLIVNGLGLGILLLPAAMVWQPLDGSDMATVLCMGPLAVCAQFAQLSALRRAPLDLIAPFRYINVPFAALLGILFLDQWPTAQALAGMVLIVAGAAYISSQIPKVSRSPAGERTADRPVSQARWGSSTPSYRPRR